MLSSHERLALRQGKNAAPRHEYLQQLVNEYVRTSQWLRKEEIVANLANFAYDPINYPTFHQLRIMELFADIVLDNEEMDTKKKIHDETDNVRYEQANKTVSSKRLVEFALSGICNCVADPTLQTSFVQYNDVVTVVKHYVLRITHDLFASIERNMTQVPFNSTLSAMTITYFLLDSSEFASIADDMMLHQMETLTSHTNQQIANIAAAFLARYNKLIFDSTTESSSSFKTVSQDTAK